MKKTEYISDNKKRNIFCIIILVFLTFSFEGCRTHRHGNIMFEVLNNDRTGLNFVNKLTSTEKFNMFTYMYFYNGAGIGAGDFNNDGLIDLFFAANQGENKLYINKGGLKFEDVTKGAKISQDSGWSTGVSVVDIK